MIFQIFLLHIVFILHKNIKEIIFLGLICVYILATSSLNYFHQIPTAASLPDSVETETKLNPDLGQVDYNSYLPRARTVDKTFSAGVNARHLAGIPSNTEG